MTETSGKYSRKKYPRPQYKRESWMNLNGKWDFAFDDDNVGEKERWFGTHTLPKEILVPFAYETKASGIEDLSYHPNVWYKKQLELDKSQDNKRVVLRFQASDFVTKVWINGTFIGVHKGGNSAFSFDITNAVSFEESNTIAVKVEDSLSKSQARGKQRWIKENFGCWYVQTTGIWQTVWIEYVNAQHIESVKITPDIDSSSVIFDYKLSDYPKKNWKFKTAVTYKGKEIRSDVSTITDKEGRATLGVVSEENEWSIYLWTPENPNLYDVTFELIIEDTSADLVESYFGMRKISIYNGKVLLNNEPIYQKLLLDQGYWPDSMLTAPTDDAFMEDIKKTKDMGFNGVRKHQKIEDQQFLHLCDTEGLLVWSEMAAAYSFDDTAVTDFTSEWMAIIQQNYNHPSIITWVPFNESWGVPKIKTNVKQQAFTESIYHLTKAYDDERPVIVNDGWEHTISDIIALHDYEESGEVFKKRYLLKDEILNNKIPHNGFKYAFAEGYQYKGQPVMLTEYGGIAFNEDRGWGYGNQVETEEEFLERYKNITDAIKEIPYISGYCYTQTTDVQQEINGLLNEDRSPKIDLVKIKEINDR